MSVWPPAFFQSAVAGQFQRIFLILRERRKATYSPIAEYLVRRDQFLPHVLLQLIPLQNTSLTGKM